MMRERVLSSVCALGRHVGVQGEEAVVAEVRNVKISHGPPDPPSLPPSPAAAAYYLPRHLAPSPTYPHLYPPYLIRGYPDTAALENRQTIINDYITSQQMHHNAASAMAQRADMLRGLSPRESSLALNYAAGPRGELPGAVPISRDLSCAVVCKRRVHTCALQLGGGAQLAGRTRWCMLAPWGKGRRGHLYLFTSRTVLSRHSCHHAPWVFACCSETLVWGIFCHPRDQNTGWMWHCTPIS